MGKKIIVSYPLRSLVKLKNLKLVVVLSKGQLQLDFFELEAR